MTWTPTLRPALAWRSARQMGGDVAARAALAAGLDTAAAWAAIADESRLAEMALDRERIDLRAVIALAIEAAGRHEKRGTLADELTAAHRDRDGRRLATIAAQAHAALAAGKCAAPLVWAADAALCFAAGDTSDARFAALEALRGVGDAPGRAERWAPYSPLPATFDPHALVELAHDETRCGRWLGFRARGEVDDDLAWRAFLALVADTGETLPTYPASVLVQRQGATWVRVPLLLEATEWAGWITAATGADFVRYRVDPHALDPRSPAEAKARAEAIEAAIEDAVRGTAWARAFAEALRVGSREDVLRGQEDTRRQHAGWTLVLTGDPGDVLALLRERRR